GDRETSDMASAEDSGYEVFDLSIPVGLAYNITDNVYVDARYNIGVTSISKDDNSDLFNNAFVLSVGFRF
ncbi:MAG: outer membrane beta-barrel protein, partial [Rikenellaceae bacterium]